MSPRFVLLGSVVAVSLMTSGTLMAQPAAPTPVKPTGPAAKKAAELIKAYTTRIEKEIDQGHKEVGRLRAELHELIDVRDAMAEAIAEMRGELATRGTFSADPVVPAQATQKTEAPAQQTEMAMHFRPDFVYGLGSSLPKEPTQEQREQLRRLAPRADLKQMIERLRTEVDETRAEVDQLACKLLELSEGKPTSFQRMGGMMSGFDGVNGQWFGSMGMSMGGMGGGMR
jgi:predicted component of type VI protein secretion system